MVPSKQNHDVTKAFYEKYKEDPVRFDDLPGVTSNWNPMRLVSLYSMLGDNAQEEWTHERMAEKLGLERSTITRKVGSVDWKDFGSKLEQFCKMTHEEYVDQAAESYRLNALARESLKQRRNEVSRLAFMKHIQERLISAVTETPRTHLSPVRIRPKTTKHRTPEHMVLLLSDQHVGLEFSKAETGGLNQYNVETYLERVANLRQALVEIYRLHAELYPIPELHVFALGDCVQGTNMGGEWGPAYNSLDIHGQSLLAADTTCQLLETWSTFFQKINFLGVVGNHGRGGVEKNSDKVSANWDNVVYSIIKERMRQHKNVQIGYSQSWWGQTNVNGTEFLLVHGDHLKHNVNALHAEEQRMQSLVTMQGRPFNVLVSGHFHSHMEVETTNGRIILNGSFIGGDVYSMRQLKARAKPTQTIMGIHPEHGITWKYCLDLERKRD